MYILALYNGGMEKIRTKKKLDSTHHPPPTYQLKHKISKAIVRSYYNRRKLNGPLAEKLRFFPPRG